MSVNRNNDYSKVTWTKYNKETKEQLIEHQAYLTRSMGGYVEECVWDGKVFKPFNKNVVPDTFGLRFMKLSDIVTLLDTIEQEVILNAEYNDNFGKDIDDGAVIGIAANRLMKQNKGNYYRNH